ncbi:hypothetical protein FKM82_000051 [Ascaphus truei]
MRRKSPYHQFIRMCALNERELAFSARGIMLPAYMAWMHYSLQQLFMCKLHLVLFYAHAKEDDFHRTHRKYWGRLPLSPGYKTRAN